jgi:hypothetical protein
MYILIYCFIVNTPLESYPFTFNHRLYTHTGQTRRLFGNVCGQQSHSPLRRHRPSRRCVNYQDFPISINAFALSNENPLTKLITPVVINSHSILTVSPRGPKQHPRGVGFAGFFFVSG